jgi:predicted RNA methylase
MYYTYTTLIHTQCPQCPTELPRKADVVVSEVLDSELLGEGLLNVLRDVRTRLLREVGSVCVVERLHQMIV